jgi:hypothetical protein
MEASLKRLEEGGINPYEDEDSPYWAKNTDLIRKTLLFGVYMEKFSPLDLVALERINRRWRDLLVDTSENGIWYQFFAILADRYKLFRDPATGIPLGEPVKQTLKKERGKALLEMSSNFRILSMAMMILVRGNWPGRKFSGADLLDADYPATAPAREPVTPNPKTIDMMHPEFGTFLIVFARINLQILWDEETDGNGLIDWIGLETDAPVRRGIANTFVVPTWSSGGELYPLESALMVVAAFVDNGAYFAEFDTGARRFRFIREKIGDPVEYGVPEVEHIQARTRKAEGTMDAALKRLRAGGINPYEDQDSPFWAQDANLIRNVILVGVLTQKFTVFDLVELEIVNRRWRDILSDAGPNGLWYSLFTALGDKYGLFRDRETGRPLMEPTAVTLKSDRGREMASLNFNYRHLTMALMQLVEDLWVGQKYSGMNLLYAAFPELAPEGEEPPEPDANPIPMRHPKYGLFFLVHRGTAVEIVRQDKSIPGFSNWALSSTGAPLLAQDGVLTMRFRRMDGHLYPLETGVMLAAVLMDAGAFLGGIDYDRENVEGKKVTRARYVREQIGEPASSDGSDVAGRRRQMKMGDELSGSALDTADILLSVRNIKPGTALQDAVFVNKNTSGYPLAVRMWVDVINEQGESDQYMGQGTDIYAFFDEMGYRKQVPGNYAMPPGVNFVELEVSGTVKNGFFYNPSVRFMNWDVGDVAPGVFTAIVQTENPVRLTTTVLDPGTLRVDDELIDFRFSTGRSRVTRIPMGKLKEAYDTWATSYDGKVLDWMREFIRTRRMDEPNKSLNTYLRVIGYEKPSAFDPRTGENILGDFGVVLNPSTFRKRITLNDEDALYLERTLSRMQATSRVEKELLQAVAEDSGASPEQVKTVVIAETARDHVQHMGDEALKAVKERDELRAQNEKLRADLEMCRQDTQKHNQQLEEYKRKLREYEERLERSLSRVAAAPVNVAPPPPPPPGPPPVPMAPPPPLPEAGSPTQQSVEAAKEAATQTITKAVQSGDSPSLNSALQNAITGFDPSRLKSASSRKLTPKQGGELSFADALARKFAGARGGDAIQEVISQLIAGKLVLTERGKIVPAEPCAVCGDVSNGTANDLRFCGQECVSAHFQSN